MSYEGGQWAQLDEDLEQEVKDLFCVMMEAELSIPRGQRQKFFMKMHMNGVYLGHPGLSTNLTVITDDLEMLAHFGLLSHTPLGGGAQHFMIMPMGRRYYEHLRSDESQRVQRIEDVTSRYIRSPNLSKRYSAAFECWSRADDLVWSDEAESRQSEIGHNCRDALVAFVNVLVETYKPEDADPDPDKFINRLAAVFAKKGISGPVSDALGTLWKYVAALSMRQDHKARREGGGLVLEDGRRVVFLTALAMFEVDRLLRSA